MPLPVTRVLNDPASCALILTLLRESFAFMEGRIDPPSSLKRMTLQSVLEHMETEVLLAVFDAANPVACLFLTHKPGHLYLGKLAVSPKARGHGHAKALLDWAERYAAKQGFDQMQLEARVELTENHAYFQRQGFVQTGHFMHEGYTKPTSLSFSKHVVQR